MSDLFGQTPDRDNIDEENLRKQLNQELSALMDEPPFQSRKSMIMAQIQAEQNRQPISVGSTSAPKRLKWFFNAPTWAGAMAAVFVLVFAGVLFAVISGNTSINTASNQAVSGATGDQARNSATTAPAAASEAGNPAGAAPVQQGTVAASFAAPPPTNRTGATAAAAAPVATIAPAAATTAAAPAATTAPAAAATTAAASAARPTTAAASATTAPAATTAASGAATTAATVAPPPTSAPLPGSGGGNASVFVPGSVALNVTPQQIEAYITDLYNARSATEKQELRLNLPSTYNYRASKIANTDTQVLVDAFLRQYPSPAYTAISSVVQDNNQAKIQILVISTTDGRQAEVIYMVLVRQPQLLDRYFGANVVNAGETLFINATPK